MPHLILPRTPNDRRCFCCFFLPGCARPPQNPAAARIVAGLAWPAPPMAPGGAWLPAITNTHRQRLCRRQSGADHPANQRHGAQHPGRRHGFVAAGQPLVKLDPADAGGAGAGRGRPGPAGAAKPRAVCQPRRQRRTAGATAKRAEPRRRRPQAPASRWRRGGGRRRAGPRQRRRGQCPRRAQRRQRTTGRQRSAN